MELGLIGLGKMGGFMAQRLAEKGHRVVVFDRHPEKRELAASHGAIPATSIEEMVSMLEGRKIVWSMVQAGAATQSVLNLLVSLLRTDDIVIDGGNSNFHESKVHAEFVESKGMQWLDVGTSGGVWGLKNGYNLMIGGKEETFKYCEPIFESLAPVDGYLHTGPAGSGHYVKMVHNGIEYGMLQAYGEGFEILKASDYDLDLYKISHLWNQASVVRSWLLELLENALGENPQLEGIAGWVADSGEGRWTIQEAIDKDVPAPVLTLSLLARFRSRQDDSYSAKVIAALRNQFGGHAVKSE